MITNAISMWYISFMEDEIDNKHSGLIDAINLCIQRIEKLFASHAEYVSMYDFITKMTSNINNKDIDISCIIQTEQLEIDKSKLVALKTILETQTPSMITKSCNLSYTKIRNREYLNKINTLLKEIVIKSEEVFTKVNAIDDLQIKILDKMSMIMNDLHIRRHKKRLLAL
jgi:hypothetical protein